MPTYGECPTLSLVPKTWPSYKVPWLVVWLASPYWLHALSIVMIAIAAFLSLLQCFHWCCQIEFKSIRLTRLQLLLFYFTIDVLSCHDLLERCKVYCKYLRDFVQVNIIPHVMACLIIRFVLLKEFRVIMYLVTGSNLSVIISTWDIMILSGLTTSTKKAGLF